MLSWISWISEDYTVKWIKRTRTCRAGLAGLAAWTTLAWAGGIGRMAWDVTGDCNVRDCPKLKSESQDLTSQWFRHTLRLDLLYNNPSLKFS